MRMITKTISKTELLELFYDCDSWVILNNRRESVDVEELITKLEEKE